MAEKYNIPALTEWATKSASQFWEYAKKRFAEHNVDIGELPEIVMNPRLTSTAGRAWNCNNKIDLSCYLMIRNFDHFHKDTIPHELCHIIASRKYNSKGHDKPWKQTVKFLNVNTSTYHNLITKSQAEKGKR